MGDVGWVRWVRWVKAEGFGVKGVGIYFGSGKKWGKMVRLRCFYYAFTYFLFFGVKKTWTGFGSV